MKKNWLGHFGFDFDPFEHEEASSDPNLNRYLIGHEAFSVAWGETPSLIFSTPGGGKTALRISASRACWTGGGGNQPFPIHYHLPHYFGKSNFSTLDDHLHKLVYSSARALFIAFCYYPLIYNDVSENLQKQLAQFILSWIPNIDYYLDILRTTNQPDMVSKQIDKSYVLHQSPDAELLRRFCKKFGGHISDQIIPISHSIDKVFNRVASWIVNDLGFRAIYVLLDGVDGFPELAREPGFAAESLFNLFASATSMTHDKVFIKGFLPLEMREHLHERLNDQWDSFDQIELKWGETLLAEVIRRRVYVATNGEFASLGAVSAIPMIRDLELELARTVNPLPREMLVLVNRVLFEYEQRWTGHQDFEQRIQIEDINEAINWYRTTQTPTTQALTLIQKGGREPST